jgi:hypothetical protein
LFDRRALIVAAAAATAPRALAHRRFALLSRSLQVWDTNKHTLRHLLS